MAGLKGIRDHCMNLFVGMPLCLNPRSNNKQRHWRFTELGIFQCQKIRTNISSFGKDLSKEPISASNVLKARIFRIQTGLHCHLTENPQPCQYCKRTYRDCGKFKVKLISYHSVSSRSPANIKCCFIQKEKSV